MKYDVVQNALEKFVLDNWDEVTPLAFDDVSFNSDMYTEFTRCNVLFGEGRSRAVGKGCYRQIGLLILSIFTKPGSGSARKLELATAAAMMLTHKVVSPIPPLERPKVTLMVPDLYKSEKEQSGWVQTQVSCPFYYDLES